MTISVPMLRLMRRLTTLRVQVCIRVSGSGLHGLCVALFMHSIVLRGNRLTIVWVIASFLMLELKTFSGVLVFGVMPMFIIVWRRFVWCF